MDITALYKISYGLYIAGVESEGKINACVINTATQLTVTPLYVSVTLLKSNYTVELIEQKQSLALSIVSMDTPLSVIQHFGGKSGRDVEKFADRTYKMDENNNPYVEGTMLAYVSLKVAQTVDLDTHVMYICEVTDTDYLSHTGTPMTYADYRRLTAKTGKKGPEAPTVSDEKQYVCSVCHYIYDGETPFEELPDDYICPVCGQYKVVFDAL